MLNLVPFVFWYKHQIMIFKSKVDEVKLHPALAASSGGTTHCKDCVRWKTGHKVCFVPLFI